MTTRCVLLIYDACLDSWWFHCEPMLAISVQCVMTWCAFLDGSTREFIPLRVLNLLCHANTMSWGTVIVIVIASRPKAPSLRAPSVQSLVYDLGLPRGWQPLDPWPSVPANVYFRWEMVSGSVLDVDSSETLRTSTLQHHSHFPPAALRLIWRNLAAPHSSPCTPEQRDSTLPS